MTPPNRLAALLVTGVLGLTALTACSSSSAPAASSSSSGSSSTRSPSASPPAASPSSATATDTGSAETATITIKDFGYSGATTVRSGAQITVENDDTEAHTVTSDTKGAFDVTINPGRSATFAAPSRAGSFAYHCAYHGNMHGTLTVS